MIKQILEESKNMSQEEFDKIEKEKGLDTKEYDLNYEDNNFKVIIEGEEFSDIFNFSEYGHNFIIELLEYFNMNVSGV